MGDRSGMSISADSPLDETLTRGSLALLLRRQYEFPFGINIVQISILISIGTFRDRVYVFIVTVWDTMVPPNFICLYVCVSRFYGSNITMDRNLIKLGRYIETETRVIVFEFHKDRVSDDVIMTSFRIPLFFFYFFKGTEFCCKGK